MSKRSKFRLTLDSKRKLMFYVFTSPFIIGFLLFFLYPFIQSIIFSLNRLEIVQGGYRLNYIGLDNYRYSLLIDPKFTRTLVETIVRMLADVPLILIFSFFAAMILNQRFRGRLFVRLIFFLPVILSAGIILQMEQMDYITSIMQAGFDEVPGLFSSATLRNFLLQLRLPLGALEYIMDAVDRIPEIINASGIQILVFLAGLQSVPASLYEAATVEGATAWESFWMITLPMLSPLILTNIVYTVIDSFTSSTNQLVKLIQSTAFGGAGYGVSTAMAALYFTAVAVILAIMIKIVSRWVFYHE